jgi:23S rRNA (cytidine1920-2'-O)/16S rRNA (cytidine1409-2'-O)-methyltransferase
MPGRTAASRGAAPRRPASKQRLDVLLVERGLAVSREQAQRLIQAGEVRVDGQPATKPGHCFPVAARLDLRAAPRFVSRGGEKLDVALDAFALDVQGRVCLDVGGFTDCLLQRGAARVYAVDVGRGQLHWKLRNDPRVVAVEGVNARHLAEGDLPGKARFAAVDVSFISLTKVLPAVIRLLERPAGLVCLIKPQFEAGRKQVGRGGVVRSAEVRAEVVEKIRRFGTEQLGLTWAGVCESPLLGPAGNVEFLACWELT